MQAYVTSWFVLLTLQAKLKLTSERILQLKIAAIKLGKSNMLFSANEDRDPGLLCTRFLGSFLSHFPFSYER